MHVYAYQLTKLIEAINCYNLILNRSKYFSQLEVKVNLMVFSTSC